MTSTWPCCAVRPPPSSTTWRAVSAAANVLRPVAGRGPRYCSWRGEPAIRIWAEQSPFELKDSLKRRGYRWNDGSDGRPKSWHIDVCETALDDELTFLRTEIYLRDVERRLQTLTAFTRFSSRV